MPIKKALKRIIFFLPKISEYGAKNKAPNAIPARPALNTTPRASGPRFQELEIAGAQ